MKKKNKGNENLYNCIFLKFYKNINWINRVDTGKDSLNNKSDNCQTFTYNRVFPSEKELQIIFNIMAKPLINSALEELINGTLFCYEQTTSGKTYTMKGIHNDSIIMGVIPRMMQYIFLLIVKPNSELNIV